MSTDQDFTDNFDITVKPAFKHNGKFRLLDVGRSTFDLKTIAHLIANKANMPYCWEDILHRLQEGLPMPFKLKDD